MGDQEHPSDALDLGAILEKLRDFTYQVQDLATEIEAHLNLLDRRQAIRENLNRRD